MGATDKRDPLESRSAEDAERTASQSAHLADAAMALLGCRTADSVYDTICDLMTLLCPNAVIIVDEITPDMRFFVTRKVVGMEGSAIAKAAELVGFDFIGKRWHIPPDFRDELLAAKVLEMPDGFASLASDDIPRPVSAIITKMFGLHDLFAVGIGDTEHVVGNFAIIMRNEGAVPPVHIVEAFARHCYSALARIAREQELANAAERHKLLLGSMVEALAVHEIIVDEKGVPTDYRFVNVNPAFEEMTGLKAADIVGRTVMEVLPGTEQALIERYARVALNGAPARFEDHDSKSGRYYEVTAFSPQKGQFATLVSDVTERKRVASELWESRERLQAILDNAPSLVYVKDLEGRLTLVNREFERLFGPTHGNLIGKTSSDLMDEAIATSHRANDLAVIAQRGPVIAEEVNEEADGTHTYLSVKFPIFDPAGEIQGVCSVSTDITARKDVERALEERTRFIEAVLENAPIGFAVNKIDDGSTVLLSPSFGRIYGLEPGGVEGVGDFFDNVYIDPVFRKQIRERITADMSSGDAARMRWQDIPLETRTGDRRYVSAINIPLIDQNLMISTVQDVTDRVRAEQEVVRQAERIQRTLTSVIDIATTIVETRDPYTAGHQRRVSQIAVRIATDMGMPDAEIADIEFAARIHDVGKVQVPAEILGKPGNISALEYEILKGHAEAGYHIVASAKMDETIAEMVYQHHERCDGSGYPRGLACDQMLPGARVLAVADVVEAMMSHRPYRPALGIEAALAEIERGAGSLYDPEVATTCIALFREKGFAFE